MIAVLLLTVLPAQADSAADLVRQLGDESFEVREAAIKKLLELGPGAEDALRKGLTAADAEVRSQCKGLLARVEESKRATRLQAFVADTDDRLKPLPGWRRYRDAAGSGPAQRKQFAAIYQLSGATLEAAEADSAKIKPLVIAHAAHVKQMLLTPTKEADLLRELTVLLVLAGDERVALDEAGFKQLCVALSILAERTVPAKAFREDAAARKLAHIALVRAGPATLPLALNTALALDLPESLDWALQLALAKDKPGPIRALAVLLSGQLGGKKVAPRLAPLLTEEAAVGTSTVDGVTLSAQLRDVTLAVLIKSVGKKPEEFGYVYFQKVLGQKTLPAPEKLGFPSAKARAAALRKWREEQGQPKKGG